MYSMYKDFLDFFVANNCQLCQKVSTRDVCPECIQHSVQPALGSRLFSVFGHSPVLISQIIRWKDFGVRSSSQDFASAFAKCLETYQHDFDALTVIPTRPESYKKRGWDPLADLGMLLASNLGVAYRPEYLVANRVIKEQRGLSDVQRKENLDGAFSSPRTNCRVLVIDDVVTSGSTLAAAKVALEKSGAVVSLGCLAYSRPVQPSGLST